MLQSASVYSVGACLCSMETCLLLQFRHSSTAELTGGGQKVWNNASACSIAMAGADTAAVTAASPSALRSVPAVWHKAFH